MLACVLLPLLPILPSLAAVARSQNLQFPLVSPEAPSSSEESQESEFSLRHIFHHGTYRDPLLHKRVDLHPESKVWITSDGGKKLDHAPRLRASSKPIRIQRLTDRRVEVVESRLAAARTPWSASTLSPPTWAVEELPGPNISDKETVLNIARMTANAYIMEPGTEKWVDVSGPFNHSTNFGWEKDGLRGHIYADQNNATVVVAIKGTSAAVFDGEETTTNDKENDNLFFSCCCAQGGQYFWRQVCDCSPSTNSCNSTCLVSALTTENRYYRAALDLYANVTALYPNSTTWLAGHSLGGSVSSMLGMTYGLPVVTFEAVPEALPASRLGLPVPPGGDSKHPQRREYSGAYHFGHTADPVYMGSCNGATSFCTLAGYAMESTCHTGQKCTYDTVKDFGWRVGIGTHRILSVITDVIEKYESVPSCVSNKECSDCGDWSYFESNGSHPTTTRTSTTSSTRTRTSTCRTPGWWGCLDKTTTTSTETSHTPTSTCKTPGWFGCNDPTTTTSSLPTTTAVPSHPATLTPTATTATTATTTSTVSCEHPGWWGGCNDPTSGATSSFSTTTCETPGYFWGCYDPTPVQTSTIRVRTTEPASF